MFGVWVVAQLPLKAVIFVPLQARRKRVAGLGWQAYNYSHVVSRNNLRGGR